MLVTPGVIHDLHPKITNHAISKCEERGDAFYILDCGINVPEPLSSRFVEFLLSNVSL